ncbi:MAG: peptidoglycan glycosyltransferase [Lachnospiraceae bacterium]|nr:peptidoglycan glycosyltransferase [Lachnospiraceae bacterium]
MYYVKTLHRRGILIIGLLFLLAVTALSARLGNLMLVQSGHYQELADELHTRERKLKAKRGEIIDRNGTVLASNRTVCTVSVVHSQITDEEAVVEVLCRELGLSEEEVRKRTEKVTAREIVKTNVDKEIGDRIREYDLSGVKVDEDYKRYYPYGELASKVLGFTGGDNQGIIGLEVQYEEVLKGIDGSILTLTDAAGLEIENAAEYRVEPVEGNTLQISLDWNIQNYVTQVCSQMMEQKQAKRVSAIVMNPENGEIYAMVSVPEFDLNDPFTLPEGTTWESGQEKQNLLNQMWRNPNISDTYEPGSTFKVITAAAALSSGAVRLEDGFSCPGFCIVEDRRIRCHKTTGHGAESFLQGFMNSCNPVFIQTGLRMGVETFYSWFQQLKLLEKTGVDLPGEAKMIMHDPEDMGEVELATVSFGQSFQLTPLRLLTTISSIINGGHTITPHFGVAVLNSDETEGYRLKRPQEEQILEEAVSETMRYCMEMVVAQGGGANGAVEGYAVGGKTATSEKLPRGNGKYISSFVGFAPADDPQVITILLIDEPVGTYYGGVIAAPAVKTVYENILPYLGIEKDEGNNG